MSEPSTPVDVYKAIIDQLVNDTRVGGSGERSRRCGEFSKAPADERSNEVIRSLSPGNRDLLAQMLSDERDGTVHDVLAELTWCITTRNVGLTFRGEPMS